ncbi:MAG: hypothetical protein LBS61_01720 [Endomicrobium sp.]|jgi:hypothetical protein|nr:hypothetical protein [Endomicrobium sp.]
MLKMEDKDFDTLRKLGCFKNRPFYLSFEALGLKGLSDEKLKQESESCKNTLSFIKDMLVMPEDITPEQAEMLFKNLNKIESFYIKAKIADVLWESNKLGGKNKEKAAEIAIKSYADFIDYVLQYCVNCENYKTIYLYSSSETDEVLRRHNEFPDKHPTLSFVKDYQIIENYDDRLCAKFVKNAALALKRSANIILSLRGKEEVFKYLMEFFNKPEFFENDREYSLLSTLGNSLCCLRKMKKSQKLFELALDKYKNKYKKLATNISTSYKLVHMYEAKIYDIGIELAERAKIENEVKFFRDEKNRVLILIIQDESIPMSMKILLNGDLLNSLSKTKDMPNGKEIVEKYKRNLLITRRAASSSEPSVISKVELNFEKFFEVLGRELQGQNFEIFLSKFVNLCIDCLLDSYSFIIAEKYKEAPLFSRIQHKHLDDVGKCSFIAKGYKENENNEIDSPICFNIDMCTKQLYIVIEYGLKEIKKYDCLSNINTHMLQMLQKSSVIPKKSVEIFAKGLEHLLRNDIIEAAHILIPNAEDCWRNILRKNSGETCIVSNNNGTERDSIDNVKFLEECLEKKLLDEEIVFYLERLLYKPFELRYKIAHGGLRDETINNAKVYTVCMLILYLALKPTKILSAKCAKSRKLLDEFKNKLTDISKSSSEDIDKQFFIQLLPSLIPDSPKLNSLYGYLDNEIVSYKISNSDKNSVYSHWIENNNIIKHYVILAIQNKTPINLLLNPLPVLYLLFYTLYFPNFSSNQPKVRESTKIIKPILELYYQADYCQGYESLNLSLYLTAVNI